ncbi:DUF2239 family protein [Gloeobacter kilaueensis]|uniref:DUF2239 family protein n=1 Tax=Gloeobacter kilaueensis (strain ATCC BAA-2537 / CCAP 1431/1 / ULC 316 / JS1) TaxID=1183438 RepID=U5QIR0_GLOK1|nr:DUF2239 family protein [Gloeobacter kilaueensis]AGY58796.1 hypothetical protein GKIL_2550 [Gloeobacter kilaueensis JS1]
MNDTEQTRYVAFANSERFAAGTLPQMAVAVKTAVDQGVPASILLFDEETGELVDLDLRGSLDDVRARYGQTKAQLPVSRGPGRPRLGVIAREVTLLPRHWEWLNTQPGGASVALRRLVDEARRTGAGRDRSRRSQEATYRFILAIAGDQPGFEEATRALFAGDRGRFVQCIQSWPPDVRNQAERLAADAFGDEG